jgi:hypothetical protein
MCIFFLAIALKTVIFKTTEHKNSLVSVCLKKNYSHLVLDVDFEETKNVVDTKIAIFVVAAF